MKVLLINGSPKVNGNTFMALSEVEKALRQDGIDTEIIQVGSQEIHGCVGCWSCSDRGCCVFDDIVNEVARKLETADGLIVGSPVYYASAPGTLVAFLDRLFASCHTDLTMKVGASVVVARRGGCSATFDMLNKYFTISGMPVVSSVYWNSVHGLTPGEVLKDEEGMRVMRQLGHNAAFLVKSIALGREKYGTPARESGPMTNFIR